MILKNLVLRNFRNYENLNISFYSNINVIHGLNAQGKTNLVEAIIYLSNLKSFRNSGENALLMKNKDSFMIEGKVIRDNNQENLKVTYVDNKRNLFVSDNKVSRNNDFCGILNALVFAPSDVSFFDDVPERRRKFIDLELSKLSPSYAYSLHQYKSLLKEKNVLLKEKMDETYFDVINEKMADLADFIIDRRIKFLKDISEYSSKIFSFLLNDREVKLDIGYKTYRDSETSLESFKNHKREEILKKKTLVGVHLDDIKVKIDGYEIENYGSQGQKRLAILSLKLGIVEFVKNSRSENIVVVLDDVLSELDVYKRKNLLEFLKNKSQVFITLANKKDIEDIELENVFYYKIENGTLKEDEPWK